jgi:hypothetical protein
MKMQDAWRTIAFGALILAVIAIGVVLLVGGGSEPAPPADAASDVPTPTAATTEQPVSTGGGGPRELELPERGTPLVWVRYGEKVEIHAAPDGPVVETVGQETEFGSRTVFSVAKTAGDWAGVRNPHTGNGSLGWVRLDPETLKAGYTTHAIVIDLSDHRAQLMREGEVIRTFTVSVGAPGRETPTGEFAVTDTFRGDLNPAYGCCAVALTAVQPNLPSGWIGGDRIAIHGTTGPLGVNISHGCVRAADRDVSALVDDVPPGAPVTIRE